MDYFSSRRGRGVVRRIRIVYEKPPIMDYVKMKIFTR